MDHPSLPKLEISAPYELVAEHLRRLIQLGIYHPGNSFPPEREHAEQLGISRLTLRSAIQLLKGAGLVETRRGAQGGAFVLAREPAARETLRARQAELEALAEFRTANERLSARRAASRIDDATLDGLEQLIAELAAAPDIWVMRRADVRFHLTIVDAAACPLLRKAVEDARAGLFLPLELLDFNHIRSTSAKEHHKILSALRSGDPSAADRAMAAHLRTYDARLSRILHDQ